MEQQYLTVTALTKYIKYKLEADPYLERIYLTGEISNFRIRPNGHQYFSLKDEQAKISAIMFRTAFQKLKFTPEEGMKVLVVGRLSLYEASGNYQLYIEHMEPDGVGALYQALEEMKRKLDAEGLFVLPKKPLPKFPKRIAVLTSPSGAVIRDIITTVKRRYPIAQLVLFPTVVQGNQSASNIVKNIQRVEELNHFDTLIIARGGGSIEDLWPFNEEIVARAIANTSIPVISSVGHETDVTIADLVADVRAPTPTAAAELAVPVLTEELARLKEKENQLFQLFSFVLKRNQQRYHHVMSSYVFTQPQRLYEGFSLKLDLLQQRLSQSGRTRYHQEEQKQRQIEQRLLAVNPLYKVKETKQSLTFLKRQLNEAIKQYQKNKQEQFGQKVQALDLLSPLKILGRGYSYTTHEVEVIHSVEQVQSQDEITVHFTDGFVQAEVVRTEKKKMENEE